MFVTAIVAPLPIPVRGMLIVAAVAMSMMSVTAANAPYPRRSRAPVERPERRVLGR